MSAVNDPRFEISDPRFDSSTGLPVSPAEPNPWRACMIGCLVVVGVAVVLFALVAFWVWQNWRDWGATAATEAMNHIIDTTTLSADDRREMKVEVKRVADAFREGRLSNERLVRIVQQVVQSPLMIVIFVDAAEKRYLNHSGLSDEEKAEGRQTLRRFVRGAVDDTIGSAAIDAVMRHVAEKQPDGSWRMKEPVSDDALRAALAEAKRAADEAKIPEQPDEVDVSAEFKRIIDEAMKQ